MWPASKVFPKELFPLGRLPALGHVISELVDAGIEEIVIVVRKDGRETIEAFLDHRIAAPDSVQGDGIVRRFEQMIRTATFTIVEQDGPYGNGTPLLNGVRLVGPHPCIYAFADDVVFGENASIGLIDTFQRTGRPVVAAQPVPEKDTPKFGILECTQTDAVQYVTRFVEKPRIGETTSTLASLGRYLITHDVVEILQDTPPGRGNELWLADAYVRMIERHLPLAAFQLTTGKWFTVGNPDGFRDAVLAAMEAEADRTMGVRGLPTL